MTILTSKDNEFFSYVHFGHFIHFIKSSSYSVKRLNISKKLQPQATSTTTKHSVRRGDMSFKTV
ncbi:hypothetical protein HanRHA438_Chr06g0255771 [Helianthus annuus]|nr:hypothetical protein HanRHA438_Chr06g0255771 [Helianthus annuus]